MAADRLPGWDDDDQERGRGPGAPCDWCGQRIPECTERGRRTRADAETCGVVCRKRRHRFKQGLGVATRGDRAGTRPVHQVGPKARFAYADPPYPGKAGKYPENEEVDHAELVARLCDEFPDGWALSTSAAALPAVLRVCPEDVRVAVWRRAPRKSLNRRAVNAWEPVILWRGRELPTDDTQHAIDVLDYRGRYDSFPGALVGMKPPEFAAWMFGQLGAAPGDELADIFPGSGAVSRAWQIMYGEDL